MGKPTGTFFDQAAGAWFYRLSARADAVGPFAGFDEASAAFWKVKRAALMSNPKRRGNPRSTKF